MRYLVLAGFCCLASREVADAQTVEASEVVVTFEETDAGLRASFEANVDLAGLGPTDAFFGEELDSRLAGGFGFGMSLSSAASAADVQEYFTEGTFEFAFNVFGDEFFNSANAIDETGDNFGVAVIGSDLPFLVYALPAGYISNSPLSGSATFVDVSLTQVSPLLGTFPLDSEGSRTITFRVSGGLPGDYSGDGVVDAADYVIWRKHKGTDFDLPNRNPDLFGVIGDADYEFWISNFGNSSTTVLRGTTPVIPEPPPFMMLVCVAFSLGLTQHRRPCRRTPGGTGRVRVRECVAGPASDHVLVARPTVWPAGSRRRRRKRDEPLFS